MFVVCSDFPSAPPPSRCKSDASLVKDDLLVHIKLKLVDQNCPQFVSKHNSVSSLSCMPYKRSLVISISTSTLML